MYGKEIYYVYPGIYAPSFRVGAEKKKTRYASRNHQIDFSRILQRKEECNNINNENLFVNKI